MITPKKIISTGMLLFAFSLPITHVAVQLAIVIILWGWLAEGVINKNWLFRFHWIFLPLVFYLLWNIVSASLSPRPSHSLFAVLDNEWPLFIMLFMAWTIQEKETLLKMVFVLLFVVFVASLYGLWQTFTGIEYHRPFPLAPMGNSLYRAVGFYGFYLTFGLLAAAGFFLSLALLWEKVRLPKYFILLPIVSFLALIGTFARSLWIAFFIVLPLIAFVRNAKKGWKVLLFVVLLGITLYAISPEVRTRALSIFIPTENQTRLNLWTTSIKIFTDHPLFGIGEDNFDYYFPLYKVPGFYDTAAHPHNDYLNALIASGIPGLAAYVAMWLIALASGWRTWKHSTEPVVRGLSLGATSSLMVFMIGALFQDYYGTFINCWLWWFIVGILVTLDLLEKGKAIK